MNLPIFRGRSEIFALAQIYFVQKFLGSDYFVFLLF